MLIGLMGAHRTGKSTLMRAFAEEHDMPYYETKTTEVWKRLDINPKSQLSFDERLTVQNHILDALIDTYDKALSEHYSSDLILVDRTPLDALAYLMAEVGNQPVNQLAYGAYRARCNLAMHKYFGGLLLVQPGIALLDAEGKGTLSPAYIEHLNAIMIGLLTNCIAVPHRMIMSSNVLELNDRMEVLRQLVDVVDDFSPTSVSMH